MRSVVNDNKTHRQKYGFLSVTNLDRLVQRATTSPCNSLAQRRITCLARCMRKVEFFVQKYTAHPGISISWRPGVRTIMSYDRRYSRLFLAPNLKWRNTIEHHAYKTLSQE
jgi:hypothetical protein